MYFGTVLPSDPIKLRVMDAIDTNKEKLRITPCTFRFVAEGGGPFIGEKNADHSLWEKDDELLQKILQTLEFSMKYPTIVVGTDRTDTDAPRKRSVLDMWRLIVPIKPEVTLWEIMSTLISNKTLFSVWYCSTVHKKVFQTPENFKRWTSYMCPSNWYHADMRDEFGLSYAEWEEMTP